MPDAPASRSVLGRGLAVLSAFGAQDSAVALADLARRTRLAKSTTYRMCQELCAAELLEKTDDGYRLGLRVFELGALAPRQRTIREDAGPVLAELQAATGLTVHLAVRDGCHVVYVDKLAGRTAAPGLPSRVGGRMPLHCTAVGKALLAHAGVDVLDAVLASGLPRLTRHTHVQPARLAEQLAMIRRTGVAHDHEESTLGVACVGAPVLDDRGRAVAAVSVAGRGGCPSSVVGASVVGAVRRAGVLLSGEVGRRSAAGGPA